MPRPGSPILTDREAQIMDVIWRRGSATAEEVRAELPEAPHDSSVRTLLRILEEKGYLTHQTRGKAYVYRPKVGRGKAQSRALKDVLGRFFAGNPEALVLRLIEEESLSPERLEGILREAAAIAAKDSAPTERDRRRASGGER
jgi:predicted transcriptional regulator